MTLLEAATGGLSTVEMSKHEWLDAQASNERQRVLKANENTLPIGIGRGSNLAAFSSS